MAVAGFRKAMTDLREPRAYCPVVTECKGMANLVAGALQLVSSLLMRCSSDSAYRTTIADRHVSIGTAAIRQGLREFVPGAAVLGMGYVVGSALPFSTNQIGLT